MDLTDEAALKRVVDGIDIQVRPASVDDGRQIDVLLEGRDISHEIRTPEVDAVVSRVAASPAVRAGLIDLQRRQIQGRARSWPAATSVRSSARTPISRSILTASPRERAQRRLLQVGGGPEQLDAIQEAD